MRKPIWILGLMLGGLALGSSDACAGGAIVPSEAAARSIVVTDVRVRDGAVSGTVENRSHSTVRGVSLLLRQEWQWADERNPGTDSPGRTLPFVLVGDVAPHTNAPFTFETPALPARSDGSFVTSMDVTGFTEVGP